MSPAWVLHPLRLTYVTHAEALKAKALAEAKGLELLASRWAKAIQLATWNLRRAA